MTTRITIVSRIFAPEGSAAAGILLAWAKAFRDRGCDVTVVTTRPPRGMRADDPDGVRMRRAPVIRDRQQYIRGYLSYLSFDVPLAFRLLFGRRADLYVVEPPPTTLAVVRVIAAMRRTPYVVRAADLWSDAAQMVTNSRLVLGLLRRVELWGMRGARHLFAAHDPLVARLRELGVTTPATGIGFGADTDAFQYEGQAVPVNPLFVYPGSYSEWHGAGIFLEAFAALLPQHPTARLRYLGNGQERPALQARAAELGIADSVAFDTPVPATDLSPILAGATASLASLKPGQGYDYAFTTKVYSSLAAGCPVVFTGVGPTVDFLRGAAEHGAGVAVDYDPEAVRAELERAIAAPLPPEGRTRLSDWARTRHSLRAVADAVVAQALAIASR